MLSSFLFLDFHRRTIIFNHILILCKILFFKFSKNYTSLFGIRFCSCRRTTLNKIFKNRSKRMDFHEMEITKRTYYISYIHHNIMDLSKNNNNYWIIFVGIRFFIFVSKLLLHVTSFIPLMQILPIGKLPGVARATYPNDIVTQQNFAILLISDK